MRWLFLLSLFLLLPVWAIDPTEVMADPKDQAMYETITQEVRCLVCQNQTIANSTAPLAADLRREIRRMIEEGQSEAEIKTFLVERYGDFVLYKPLFRKWNLVLWLGPIVLLLIGLVALSLIVRRRTKLPINEDAP
ncbi:MAG: cytochrome c-type biogenesis protein CcmH [Gammaproteobacteria bacterium]|nr:cytochrome c-type biogenesis protein CcmH [Gammaproteobacteria bacterium]MCP4090473.1 cytochrome c-type biogenesis protein CcmH [Gammaproteobacteria bacterium]MCP4276662.1 cytochrome c-type biogenesis protein CcmH [Gammaproteobacteria bacterium]MCP4831412.1 cytochrome c-type biogenesis protein CcmH [Gammaproteobacteria bacterium]MCP4927956.1 cytochrome c-type biogenesis protein CcmH [Gammaproteobacteria bacterium]